jgi:hypothetical protein
MNAKPSNRKIISVIFIAIFCALFLLFAAPHILELVGRAQVPEMTQEKAQRLFETVGGVNEVNREAKVLFNQLGTNEWTFLYPQDLTNSPAISSLYSILKNYSGREYSGTDVAIFPENGRHLEIKFGNHWSLKWIYIFDTNKATKFNSSSNYFQITSNIFASK